MTDISKYLDFVMTLFLAFGITFEVPIATIILVATGMTTIDQLSRARGYVVVGAFASGMLLTPPDVISQTLLALPMWLLFEAGIVMARILLPHREQRRKNRRIRRAADCHCHRRHRFGRQPEYVPECAILRAEQQQLEQQQQHHDQPHDDAGQPGRPRQALNRMPMMTATGSTTSSKPRPSTRKGSQLTNSARKPVTSAAPSLSWRNQINGIAK